MKLQFAFLLALSALLSCTDASPGILGVSDQTAYVGRELVIELRAVDVPVGESPSFSFSTAAEGMSAHATVDSAGLHGAALFRWTPSAADIGEWIVDFEVKAGGSGVVAVETVTIQVRPTAQGEPVFQSPAGSGVTYDPSVEPCLEIPILVEDPDSASVAIAAAGDVLPGATLEQTGDSSALWKWCPQRSEFVLPTKHVLSFIADDGENEPVSKTYVVVIRPDTTGATVDLSGWLVTGSSPQCFFQLKAGSVAMRGSTVVLSRNADQADFEDFWGREIPSSTLFINTEEGCPKISGGQRFSLHSSGGELADGPTPPILAEGNLQRKTVTGPSSRFGSWELGSAADATPGTSFEAESAVGIYISEVSDAIGEDSAKFQYLELTVD